VTDAEQNGEKVSSMPDFNRGGMSVDEFILSLNRTEGDEMDPSARALNRFVDGLWISLLALQEISGAKTLPLKRPNGFVREVLRCMSQWEVESAT
jgi:hypothetical protein